MHPSDNGQSSEKRGPEEIEKQLHQLQAVQKKRPLINSQETIEKLNKELLELRLKFYHLSSKGSDTNVTNITGIDGIKQDLVADFMKKNEKLTKQVEELTKKLENKDNKSKKEENKRASRLKDVGCQTNLDSINIEKLVKASIDLKKYKEQQREQQEEFYMQTPTQPNYRSNRQSHNEQQRHQIMSQLQYPHVTLPKQPVTSGSMYPDEKKILEELYRTNGMLTTARDILRVKAESHP